MSSTLLIQTGWIGDLVLTTPLIATLAERYGAVSVVATPDSAPLLAHDPAVAEVIPFAKRRRRRTVPPSDRPTGLIEITSRLRARGFARAFLPHQSVRSALLALLAGIPERVGFAGAPGHLLYSLRIAPPPGHEADRLLALAGDPGVSGRPVLHLSDADRAAADQALTAAGIDLARPFVLLFPGSAWATKRWTGFRDLALLLAGDAQVAVGGTRSESLGTLPQVADLTGRLTLREAAWAIARAALVVCNDSAPLHMAQAAGTRTIAIFGPTHPGLGFGPRNDGDRVLQLEHLPCRPCTKHGSDRCPLAHHRCMRDLSPAHVLSAIREVLAL